MKRIETRKCARYPVTAVVVFRWRDEGRAMREAQGCTRDISVGGVFVATNSAVMSGTRVTLQMMLPSLGAENSGSRLEAQGRVVRIERGEDGLVAGFAVASESMVLRNGSPQRSYRERMTAMSAKP